MSRLENALKTFVERVVRRILNSEVHTTMVGQVVSYDGATNTCSVQPVQKRIRINDPNNLTTIQLTQLDGLPVKQHGNGKLLFSLAPQVGSYGLIHVCERDIVNWMNEGGIAEQAESRSFDYSDSFFDPGAYPLIADGDNGLIEEPILTDRIQLRTRSAVTAISVVDDETIEIKNENCTVGVDVDGNVSVVTAGTVDATSDGAISVESTGDAVSVTADGDVTLTAGGNVITSATETVVQGGTDYAVQYTAMKSAFDSLKSELNTLVTVFTAHVHPGVLAGPASTGPTPTPGTPPAADMSGAQVSDVRLP